MTPNLAPSGSVPFYTISLPTVGEGNSREMAFRMGKKRALLVVAICSWGGAAMGSVAKPRASTLPSRQLFCEAPVVSVRGGASSSTSSTKKTKKSSNKRSSGKTKKAIDTAMKEKDAAKALGDAIR